MFLKMPLRKIKNTKKYSGYTLLEMLITIAIISFVIMLVGVTLTTLIRTSMVSSIKMQIRDEADLIFDVIERNIKQTDPANILIYNSSNVRRYENGVVFTNDASANLITAYSTLLPEGDLTVAPNIANEIHVLPNKSTRWICIGFFKNSAGTQGYIVKSSYPAMSGSDHRKCFDSTEKEYMKNAIVLNSDDNNIQKMGVTFFRTGGDNAMFTFDLSMKTTKRYGAQDLGSIDRQLVVSTQKLTKN